MKIKYSICICNYNMGRTIAQSLFSLFSQLDDRFEVVIVDDGSNDNSLDIIRDFQLHHANLKLLSLQRDRKRKLGYTRNISIQEASGEYVILHLDCDDTYGPYIIDFTEVFHRIEKQIGKDYLLYGKHILMARRQFLLQYGPYANVYRGEDAHLLRRMASMDALILLEHIDFITRIPPPSKKKRIKKMLYDTFDHQTNNFRFQRPFSQAFLREIDFRNANKKKNRNIVFFIRCLLLVLARIAAFFSRPLPKSENIGYWKEFEIYRKKATGTYAETMLRYGGDPDLSFLRKEAQHIFSHRS